MESVKNQFDLEFEGGFCDRDEQEARDAGYRGGVTVSLGPGRRYSVTFYDPVRLAQDLATEKSAGAACIAEPGMIVVPEVTKENMRMAVEQLVGEGFFETLKPTALHMSKSFSANLTSSIANV